MPSRQHRRFEALKPARKRFDNPYFRSRQSDHLKSSRVKRLASRLSPRVWVYSFLALVLIAAAVWLFAFSNVFVIKSVRIVGVPDAEMIAYEALVWQQSEQSRLWLLSQDRLFVFDDNALMRAINDKYALAGLRVLKKLPDTIELRISERTPALVWFEADEYYLVDTEGWIIRSVAGPDAELPTLYNNGEAHRSGKRIEGQSEAIRAAQGLQGEFKGRFSTLGYRQLVVDNSLHTITVVLPKGQLLYLSTDQSLSDQLDRFDLLLKERLSTELPKLQYVDLRYDDKIYYK